MLCARRHLAQDLAGAYCLDLVGRSGRQPGPKGRNDRERCRRMLGPNKPRAENATNSERCRPEHGVGGCEAKQAEGSPAQCAPAAPKSRSDRARRRIPSAALPRPGAVILGLRRPRKCDLALAVPGVALQQELRPASALIAYHAAQASTASRCHLVPHPPEMDGRTLAISRPVGGVATCLSQLA
jgi:hypothetical protein